MAGSYQHCVTGEGELRQDSFEDLIENLGDAYEAIEEMYGMIWWLAHGDAALVKDAQQNYVRGLEASPGPEAD